MRAPIPPRPGVVIRQKFMPAYGIRVTNIANDLGIARTTLWRLMAGRTAMSAKMALLLGKYFGTGERYWMRLQTEHDLAIGRRQHGAKVARIKPLQKRRKPRD